MGCGGIGGGEGAGGGGPSDDTLLGDGETADTDPAEVSLVVVVAGVVSLDAFGTESPCTRTNTSDVPAMPMTRPTTPPAMRLRSDVRLTQSVSQ